MNGYVEQSYLVADHMEGKGGVLGEFSSPWSYLSYGFCYCDQTTMTKEAYKKKHFTGLMLSEIRVHNGRI